MEDKNNEIHADQAAINFKAFLMKTSKKTNLNLYDHLVRLLTRVMDNLPDDAVDVIEDLSYEVKRSMSQYQESNLQDIMPIPKPLQFAQQQKSLFIPVEGEDVLQAQYMGETCLPNVADILMFLEQTDVGLEKEEIWKIFLALKQLVDTKPLRHCRFWGKIFGVDANYIVAEVEYREGEEEEEESIGKSDKDEKRERTSEGREEGEGEVEVSNTLPKSTYKLPPVPPKEPPGTGANKFIYFVCQEPGMTWVRLPSVSPSQIQVAKQICKLFVGRLDAPVVSYPPFPGNEANYLRAQVARISAATQVSPLGFYKFREDEEEEGVQSSLEENLDFEGIPASEMAESLSTWVHHTEYILSQGRCFWVNLSEKSEPEEDEEAEEEKEEEAQEEPEVGPPLLTPLSDDAECGNSPAWTLKISSRLIPQYAIAMACSNLWPGAFAFASGKRFMNIYAGWGNRYSGDGYTPPLPTEPMLDYPVGDECNETIDPTLEEEQAFKAALDKLQAKDEENKEQEEEEKEEEEEEEYD